MRSTRKKLPKAGDKVSVTNANECSLANSAESFVGCAFREQSSLGAYTLGPENNAELSHKNLPYNLSA